MVQGFSFSNCTTCLLFSSCDVVNLPTVGLIMVYLASYYVWGMRFVSKQLYPTASLKQSL